MAHTCPECGLKCHCGGDIDDINFGDPSKFCTHCDTEEDEDECDENPEYEDYPGNPPLR